MDEKRVARFWAKVDKRGLDECWLWTATRTRKGYGQFRVGSKLQHAHRVSWELANGPIPEGTGFHGTCVCHRCDVPLCVNPAHLFLGSCAENLADMRAKGRANHAVGEAIGCAKLTAADVMEIRRLKKTGLSEAKLGARFGVSSSAVHRIVSGNGWSHVSDEVGS